jgi:beta-glucosidase
VVLNLADLNGVPVHADRDLITGLLKGELGFAGVAVSDWMAVDYLFSHHHVAEDPRQAVALAVNAGVDLVMVPFDLAFGDHLETLVREGRVPLARIDDAVRRVLAFKQDLGLFEEAVHPAARHPRYGAAEFRETARRAAAESLTLLKNARRALPLAPDARVLVTGPAAHSMAALNGGWSYTWQGVETDRYHSGPTILDALRDKLGAGRVVFTPAPADDPADLERAAQAAAGVDAVVACLGEAPYAEVFGNVDDLALPRPQVELVQRLGRMGKPMVLVLVQGRPRIITGIEPIADAIVLAYLPGNEGGRAVADLLVGDAEPAGRLPFTYPIGPNALSTYDHRRAEAYAFKALYPFGAGLAYTTFQYADLILEPPRLAPDGELRVTVALRNTGARPGSEVVQLYTSDPVASLGPPVKRLRAFRKVALAPGEARRVAFTLTPRDLAFVRADLHRVAEAGEFTVTVGDLTRPFVLTGSREYPAAAP